MHQILCQNWLKHVRKFEIASARIGDYILGKKNKSVSGTDFSNAPKEHMKTMTPGTHDRWDAF